MSTSATSLAARILKPRSIAIIGASADPRAPGGGVLANLDRFGFADPLHLVNPNRSEIGGRPCLASVDDLPEGVDLAVFAISQAATLSAFEACARRGVRSAMIFASGFAETGGEGRQVQDRISEIAREKDIVVAGPNCLGFVNFVDGIPVTFGAVTPKVSDGTPSIAILSQSGAMSSSIRFACVGRGIPISYSISTGNEAGIGIEDYLDYVIDDSETRVIAMYVEQFRRPQRVIELLRKASAAGKPVVLLHPGRSAAARESAQSHTGAMAGDYSVMRVAVEQAGALCVDTIEDLIDVSELLYHFSPPKGGVGIITDSGAYKGLALDYCADIGLELPPIKDQTEVRLRAVLPPFVEATNPLDLTAQSMRDGELYRKTIEPMIDDPDIGSAMFCVILGTKEASLQRGRRILASIPKSEKPIVIGVLGDDGPLDEALIAEVRASGTPFFRSPERALRALAKVTSYGQRSRRAEAPGVKSLADVPIVPGAFLGTLPEYRSKQLLASAGVPVPGGRLATTVAEALKIAAEIGYPVALKAQSEALSHKSDAGGVVLGLTDDPSLTEGWRKLDASMRSIVGLELDGVLVERMAKRGLEMIIGAKRDPQWGAVIVVGLGGIWTEALNDFVVFSPEADRDAIIANLRKLKAARLFDGYRGSGRLDIDAAADVIGSISAFVRANPSVSEIDVNPLVVHGEGEGAVALDGLIVVAPTAKA